MTPDQEELAKFIKHQEAARSALIERARAASLLDAAFLVLRFNRRTNNLRQVADILPEEVCPEVAPENWKAASRRAGELYFTGSAALGAAYLGYPGAPPFTQALAAVKARYPGFSEETYRTAEWDGCEGMR